MSVSIHLKAGKEESLKRFHPWVFSGAIDRLEGEAADGCLARILDSKGRFLAIGHCSFRDAAGPAPQFGSIALRALTWDDRPIDASFWQERLASALHLRHALGLTGDGCMYRLVHGEGDSLPGLVVDVYGQCAVVQSHSSGMHASRHDIALALKQTLGSSLTSIYYKSDATMPQGSADALPSDGWLWGKQSEVTATENGKLFHIDVRRGQKTGFFIDQRDNRSLLQAYAKGRSVLNLFCYTGGFSVYALAGGAERVCSADSSARAVDLLRANVEANDFGTDRHEAVVSDAFECLDSLSPGEHDLIILDPPAFAKHLSGLRRALHGYTKLNAKALAKLRPGGILFTFSCSQAVSASQFREAVFTAATLAGRRVRILHQMHQAPDHPVNIFHPEGDYLKGLALYAE